MAKVYPWDEFHVKVLRDETAKGRSARTIASILTQKFGIRVTRNAVIGKWSRMGLSVRTGLGDNGFLKQFKGSKKKKPKQAAKPDAPASPVFKAVPFLVRADLPPALARKRFIDLADDDCKWPVGDPLKPGFGFCALPRFPGRPYCETCCQRAYTPVPKRARDRDPVPTREPVTA